MSSIIGIIGIIFLAIGWIPETISVIREKHSKINPKFGVLYVLGSLLLTWYAIEIKDTIFIILNLLVALMSFVSLIFSLNKTKRKK